MAIIVSKNGKNAIKINKSNFELEDHLQQYIYDNPESIPLYDIKEDIRLLILAREFTTKSGSIDALGVDREGEIYLIETKLYKNPDKRMVVAQVLDYGASLWSNYRDFTDFVEQVSLNTNKDFNKTLSQRLGEFFGISEDETDNLLENTRRNLSDGNFKFVVLMDHLHPQLKDLIIFLNNNSEFTVYAVELEFYKHKGFEILIPKLFGAEVKKDLGVKSTRSIPTDEDFVEAYQGLAEEKNIKKLIIFFNQLKERGKEVKNVAVVKTPRNLNFYVTTSIGDKITISFPIVAGNQGPKLEFWGTKNIDQESRKIIKEVIPEAEISEKMKTSFGIMAKWRIKDYSIKAFEQLLKQLAKI
ncbi:MAG: hypothetical protein ABIB61_02930 [Candidatus Shapirobacteria bacterium]